MTGLLSEEEQAKQVRQTAENKGRSPGNCCRLKMEGFKINENL